MKENINKKLFRGYYSDLIKYHQVRMREGRRVYWFDKQSLTVQFLLVGLGILGVFLLAGVITLGLLLLGFLDFWV